MGRFIWIALGLGLVGACSGGGGKAEWRPIFSDLDRVVLSASGPSTDDLWIAGGGLGNGAPSLAMHYDGTSWREVDTGSADSFWWVWADGSGAAFFVGEAGTFVRWDGSSATRIDTGVSSTLFGVWGSSPSDVWIVGGDPFAMDEQDILLHWDGSRITRTTLAAPPGAALFKVWGSSASDVWAVGQHGVILHYDGSAWSSSESGTMASLFTVYAVAPDDAWAVGGPPRALLHWDGTSWNAQDPFGYGSQLNGVSANARGDVLVVGVGGTKWVREHGTWTDESDFEPFDDLHGAWLDGTGEGLAVGGNFLAAPSPGSLRIGVVSARSKGALSTRIE
jgi:hypothetical protein